MRHGLGCVLGGVEENATFVQPDRNCASGKARHRFQRRQRRGGRQIEPVTLIYLKAYYAGDVVEQFARAPVEDELQQVLVASPKQFHAWRFVYAARFHAYEAVLHDMRANAHGMFTSNAVRILEHLD